MQLKILSGVLWKGLSNLSKIPSTGSPRGREPIEIYVSRGCAILKQGKISRFESQELASGHRSLGLGRGWEEDLTVEVSKIGELRGREATRTPQTPPPRKYSNRALQDHLI